MSTAACAGAPAKASRKKPAPPKTLEVDVTIVRPGGWSSITGQVAIVYDERLRGRVEVINRGHLYHSEAGRDLYPTAEQFDALCRGEQVRFGMSQWA